MPQTALDWMAGPAIPLSMPAWAGAIPLGNFGDPGALPLGDAARGGSGGLPLGDAATTRYSDPLSIVFNTPKLEQERREERARKAEERERGSAGKQAQGVGQAAQQRHQAGVPTTVPAEYQGVLQEAATRYGVDPALLAAQIKQESGWNPQARSPAGAAGIAQFMPGTAAQYRVNVNDPASSIDGMARYMADLLRQYNGNVNEALAAYNGGGGAVQRLRAGHPYSETQQYLAMVNRYLEGYRAETSAAAPPAYPATPDALLPALKTPFSGASYRVAFDVHQPYTVPLPGGTTHHRGVDLVPTEGGIGAPVTALAGGTVVDFRQGGAQGNAVVLQAGDGTYHAYFHLLDPNQLRPGTVIQPGQQIGRMGQSGSEGFPHLHLEVRRHINGDPRGAVIDPLAYFGLR